MQQSLFSRLGVLKPATHRSKNSNQKLAILKITQTIKSINRTAPSPKNRTSSVEVFFHAVAV